MIIKFRLISNADHTSPVIDGSPNILINGVQVNGITQEEGNGVYSFTSNSIQGVGPFVLTATDSASDPAIVYFYPSQESVSGAPIYPYSGPFRVTPYYVSNMSNTGA